MRCIERRVPAAKQFAAAITGIAVFREAERVPMGSGGVPPAKTSLLESNCSRPYSGESSAKPCGRKGSNISCRITCGESRRFLQHVLPAGFQRIRHFGLLNEHSRLGVFDAREAIGETAAADEQPAHNRSGDSLADEPSFGASPAEDCSEEPSSDNRRRPLCPECGK